MEQYSRGLNNWLMIKSRSFNCFQHNYILIEFVYDDPQITDVRLILIKASNKMHRFQYIAHKSLDKAFESLSPSNI